MVIMVIKLTKVPTDLCTESVYGYQRPYMVTSGFVWLSWLSVVISGFLWLPEPVHGHQWFLWLSWLSIHQCFYGYHGYQWLYQWFPLVTRDCAWSPVVFMVIMVISGYQWFPVVTTACVLSPVVFMVISGYMHGYCDYQWLCMVISGHAWLSVVVCMATQVPYSSRFVQIQKPSKMCVLVWYAK